MPSGWGAHMTDGAKRFWKMHASNLADKGVLTEFDLPALRILAELWSQWVRTQTLAKKETDPKLLLAYMRMVDKLATQVLRYMQEFGMTPSGRGKVGVVDPEKPEADPIEAMLKGRDDGA